MDFEGPLHHQLARRSAEYALARVQSSEWVLSGFTAADTRYGKVAGSTWPVPDSLLVDDAASLTLAMEFKPPNETKRGCLTGLGQALAYLKDHSASMLVVPSHVEGYGIGEFIREVCDSLEMGAVPIGVAAYAPSDAGQPVLPLNLLRPVPNTQLRHSTARVESTYWANWRDTHPSELFELLRIADRLAQTGAISQARIWDDFWDHYWNVNGASTTLAPVNSTLTTFGGQVIKPFEKTKEILRKRIANNQLSTAAALAQLATRASKTVTDSNYEGLRKNHFNFMNQLGLWDGEGRLLASGVQLREIGIRNGPNSSAFLDALARLVLVEGSHLELILDFEESNEALARGTLQATSTADVRGDVWLRLNDRGLIKRNPNRTVSGAKAKLPEENTLWAHLGLLKKNGSSFFFPDRGLIFDWARIARLITSDASF